MSPGASLRALKGLFPDQYRNWVMTGTLAATLGYAVSALARLPALYPSELVVVAVAALATWLVRRGHVEFGAYVVLAIVWLEFHYSYLVTNEGLGSSTTSALGVYVLVVGLYFGGRAAVFMAAALTLTVPGALLLGARIYGTRGLPESQLPHLMIAVAVMVATGAILLVYLRTLGHVIQIAEEHAARAEHLVEGSPDALVAVNANGKIDAFNSAAERLLGIERRRALGHELSILPLESDKAAEPPLNELLDSATRLELKVQGTDRVVEVRSQGTAGGGAVHILVFRDISDRRQAEQQARQLQQQLQHAQKMEAVGRLAGGVAHDFNNLLTAVGGYGELLGDADQDWVQELGKELVDAQERGSALTRQLLAFARKEVAQPTILDVSQIVTKARRLIERIVGEQVRVTLELEERCMVLADPGHIEQILLNLASNARDAMPRGGQLSVCVRSVPEDAQVELSVEDTGGGIEAGTEGFIFEPFFTTKERGKGTGLGLATVHGIVTQYNGRIDVESKPDEGATFRIRFPSEAGTEESASNEREALPLVTGSGVVLVAEDDDGARRYVTRVLRKAGFNPLVASNATEALELAASSGAPRLLLTDVMMPGLSGVELAERLKRRFPQMPVLFMTGYADDVLDHQLEKAGEVLLKPFTSSELLKAVERKVSSRGEPRRALPEERQPTTN